MVPGTLVPPDFKECCIRYSRNLFKFRYKVLPVNSEVLVHLKNIEGPMRRSYIQLNDNNFCFVLDQHAQLDCYSAN